jgi:glucosamine--fructose-6-phosphate aminotransferase (isomerizing)
VCGIVAAVPDYSVQLEEVTSAQLLDSLPEPPTADPAGPAEHARLIALLDLLVKDLSNAVALHTEPTGCYRLIVDADLRRRVQARVDAHTGWLDALDRGLDDGRHVLNPEQLESVQRLAGQARDLLWTIANDRVRVAERVSGLARGELANVNVGRACLAIDATLEAIDRLEVRGRDSAGLQVWVTLDAADRTAAAGLYAGRTDPSYGHTAVTLLDAGLTLVYKRASIIGRLGDNVAFLRAAIEADDYLHTVLAMPSARVTVLAHTRWASVGRISEANAHPVDSAAGAHGGNGYATAVLNGDIDNHVDLRETLDLPVDEAGITTDAKVIPVMLRRELNAETDPVQAFAASIRRFHGSFAIAAQSDADPDRLLLAVRGSGQGLYVGFAPACFLVASEVYGLVGWTDRYLRLDGAVVDGDGEHGTVVALSRAGAGTLAAMERFTVLGRPVPVTEEHVSTAEITTRDVARGSFEHYLVKEITEAPSSFRRSLRGRIVASGEHLTTMLGDASLPRELRDRFAAGEITEILFVGQGTAAVACRGIANVVRPLLQPAIAVEAMPATELSAWGLRPDMSSVCIVAVSQSGSTTDTNRAVDMVRARGAAVLGIVNRRDSDLAHKSDGVLYTSDGRDVEMAVASTKAFYSQVATGSVLGLHLARVCGRLAVELENTLLHALLEMPNQLAELRAQEPVIARISEVALRYPHWAVVGSGPNRVAAEEARIKLSELCYKTISTDAVEDKKHVDLSAEAFILICAAGTPPGQVRDLAKEVDIFAAHRNAPVIIVDEGMDVPWATEWVVRVPAAHPVFAWILSTAAGHLFSYHTARAIDAKADPLRGALAALEGCVDRGETTLQDIGRAITDLHPFLAAAADSTMRGVLASDTALRLCDVALLLRHGGWLVTAPRVAADPIDFTRARITAAVDELTRSIDSVKHQAKTVTVGTSRGDSDLVDNPLTSAIVEVGADPSTMSYSVLVALRAFARVVDHIDGATRYQLGWSPQRTTIRVVRRSGVSEGLPSRAHDGAELSGSKWLAVQSRMVRLVRGARDGRLVLLVPELTGARINALTLLHVGLHDSAEAAHLSEILDATGTRLDEIQAAVTELDSRFDVDALAKLSVETVLLAPVDEVARSLTGTA